MKKTKRQNVKGKSMQVVTDYRTIHSYLYSWQYKRKRYFYDIDTMEYTEILPCGNIKVFAKISTIAKTEIDKKNKSAIIEVMREALESGNVKISVLIPHYGEFLHIPIPQAFAKYYVEIKAFNTDLVEYNAENNEITCYSFDVYLMENKEEHEND